MLFKKFFVGVLLVFGFETSSIIAAEPETEEYTMLKFFQQAKTAGDVSKVLSGVATVFDLTDLDVVNALLASQKNTYIELGALYDVRKAAGKSIGLSFIKDARDDILDDISNKALTYFELSDKYSVGLDILGLGLDAYDVGQNIGRLVEGDGSVLVNSLKLSQNVYGVITGSASVVASLVPQGTIASTKFVNFYKNASTGFSRSNILLLALQLNSMAYSAARDSIIEDTKGHFQSEYSAMLSSRNNIIKLLTDAYEEDSNLTQADIAALIQIKSVFTESMSDGTLKNVRMVDIYNEYMTNGSIYLQNKFSISDSSSLSGFNKIVVALDALAYMSSLEDTEFSKRLDTTIGTSPNWAASLENWLAGAFSGEDAYQIFSTEDMKKKLIPSEIIFGSDIIGSRVEYYQMMYFNIFAGDVGQKFMKYASQIGEAINPLIENTEVIKEETSIIPTLLFTLPQTATIENNSTITAPQGETVSFTPDYTAKAFIKCVNDANITDIDGGVYYETANADLEWKLWYVDDSTGLGGTDIILQREGNGFSFTSPKSTSLMITSITYSTEGKRDQRSCSLPKVWESIETGGGDSNTTATNPLKRTGQTTSYTAGDDGSYRAGVTPSYARSAAGVVTDHVTNLEWQDDYSDNGGSIKSANWQGAIDYCNGLALDGGGWRLPSIEEVETIVDDGRYYSAIDTTFSNISSSDYWSSTTYAYYTSYAWYVLFNLGHSYSRNKTDNFYVRCVRGGQ